MGWSSAAAGAGPFAIDNMAIIAETAIDETARILPPRIQNERRIPQIAAAAR
jgi:hypothetical protein